MKALLFTDSGKSSIADSKKPAINDFELLVQVKACAICGTDIKLDKGSRKTDAPIIPTTLSPFFTGIAITTDFFPVERLITSEPISGLPAMTLEK